MRTLTKNWITENHIDFEYKKYVLLAYLQHVSENFTEQRLYPYLSDLVDHYRNLKLIKENKQQIFERFPGRLIGTDLDQFRLLYEKMVEDDSIMREIESIIDFSIPQMEKYLRDGKKIYDFLEEHLTMYPVGVIPLHNEEGYIFLRMGACTDTWVYTYQISFFENPSERFRGIHLKYMTTYEKSLLNTFESIKADLISYNRSLPNPAAYVLESEFSLPFNETLLPIAKRFVVKRLAGAA